MWKTGRSVRVSRIIQSLGLRVVLLATNLIFNSSKCARKLANLSLVYLCLQVWYAARS